MSSASCRPLCRRRQPLPPWPTISASRSDPVRLVDRRTRDHRAAADAGRRHRRRPAAVDGAGARDGRPPVQPRTVRGRQRRRDARGRTGRAALRPRADSSGRAHPLRRPAGSAGHRPGRRCGAPSSTATACRPPLGTRRGHDADPRRRAARARLPAPRRSRRDRSSSTTPERATLVFTIDPGRAPRSATVEIVGAPTVSRARDSSSRLGRAPGAPYQREALNARIEQIHRGAPQQGLLRGEDRCRSVAALGGRPRRRPDADRQPGTARVRVVFTRRSAAVGPAAPSWCRWSARARSTRICSRTRATASRNTCGRRGIATRGRRTRARSTDGELRDHVRGDARPAVQGGVVRDLRATPRCRSSEFESALAAARRPAVLGGHGSTPMSRLIEDLLPPARFRVRAASDPAVEVVDRRRRRRRRCRSRCAAVISEGPRHDARRA